MLHTIIYDGDQNRDFISGLGIRFSMPMRDALYDRHIRFATDDGGVWGEAVQGLTGLQQDPGAEVREAQVAGRKTPPLESWKPGVSKGLDYVPAFGDFTLVATFLRRVRDPQAHQTGVHVSQQLDGPPGGGPRLSRRTRRRAGVRHPQLLAEPPDAS